MSSILRVAARVIAMVHPSEEARKKYLKDHPGADPKNHQVDKSRPEDGDEKHDKYDDEVKRVSEGDKKKIERLRQDLGQSVHTKPGGSVHSVLKALHKGEKLPPRLTQKAIKNLHAIADQEKNPEVRKSRKEQAEMFERLVKSVGGKDD
jgi:hypothetical protein